MLFRILVRNGLPGCTIWFALTLTIGAFVGWVSHVFGLGW